MKLATLLLLVGFLQVSARSYGQQINLHEKNASLESVLQKIRAQSGYDILFDLALIVEAKPVSVDVQNASVEQALQASLTGQPLSFSIENRTIAIRRKGMVDKVKELLRPPATLRCVVLDSTGTPLPGATIGIKNTKQYFATDNKGEVVVPGISEDGVILVVSYVGYRTREVYVNSTSKSPFEVVLRSNANRLNEVTVVNNGYSKANRDREAGAYATLSSEEISKTPSVNLLDRLEGKLPGVKIDARTNTLQIRGTSNYGTLGNPLIVIDGFPLISANDQPRLSNIVGTVSTNAIVNAFNPEDIEQITVLKDASATSIWGARAANGVIVIETKKGKRGTPPSFNATYNLGISQRPNLNNLHWLNSAQYINLEQELVDKGFLSDPALASASSALYAANNSEATEWMFRVKRGTATVAQRDAALAELGTRNSLEQVDKYLLRNAISHQATVAFSGGADRATYAFSANYTKDQPFYRSNSADNLIVNANLASDFFNRRLNVRVGLNYQYVNTQYNGAATDALAVSTTSLRPYDLLVDGSGNHIQRTILFRQSVADQLTAQGYLPFGYNALDELNYSNSITKNNNLRLIAGLNGKIFSWLNADLSIGSQQQFGNTTTINELNSYYSRILVNTGTSVSNGKLVYGVPYGGVYTLGNQTAYDTDVRGQLTGRYLWEDGSQLTALAGAEVRETGAENSSAARYGFSQDTYTIQAFNPTTPYMTLYGYTQTLGNNLSGIALSRKRFLSYYGNAAYSFRNKYVATGSLRFDDYTLVGVDRKNRAVPFWSGGLRWNASREPFLASVSWLTEAALRATVGTGGNVPQNGSNVTVIAVSGTDSRTQQPVASIVTPGNAGLTWEKTRQLNLGLDFSLFKGRLFGSFDIYDKHSSDIVASLPYNATYGTSTLTYNTASLTTRGLELGVTGELVNHKFFKWNTTFNFTYSNNEVTDSRYASTAGSLVNNPGPVQGLPIGALFVYRWAGLDNKGQSQIYDRNDGIISNTTNLTSDFTRADLKYAGTTVAPYSGGFFNTFTFGPFTASAQIAYYLGNVFLKQSVNNNNYPTYQGSYVGVLGRVADLDKRWRQPGDEATTDVPGLSNINNNSLVRYQLSDLLVRKGDNVRLQQVSLGYTVPARYLPGSVFKSLTVSANMRNLGILWRANKDGIDPLYVSTSNYSQLSPAPSYVFGVNASF